MAKNAAELRKCRAKWRRVFGPGVDIEDVVAAECKPKRAASSAGGWLTFLVIGGITVALLADW